MLNIDFCKECFYSIHLLGFSHVELYEDICKQYLLNNNGCIFLESRKYDYDFYILHRLENHGFVISTELSKRRLTVKPLGVNFYDVALDSPQILICFKFFNHFKES